MKNLFKKFLIICSVLCITFNSNIIAFANESASSDSDIAVTPDGIEVSVATNLSSSDDANLRFVPNWVVCAITPQSDSYKITFTNIGLDSIDSLTMNLTVKKDNGTVYATTSKTFTNMPVGNTEYTWYLAKGSVQETITLTGTASDGGQTIALNEGSTERWNFAGGKYGTMDALDGQRHHMPSDNASPLSAYSGPCIRMRTADHKLTASYGSSSSAVAFRNQEKDLISNGKFLAAQQLGIDDVKKLFGVKYNWAIDEMVTYTRSLGYTQ